MRRSAKEQTLTWMNTKWHAVVLPIRADDIQSDLSPAQVIMLMPSWAVWPDKGANDFYRHNIKYEASGHQL